jgi:hypothetical protein
MKISKKRNHVLNVAAFAWISPALLTQAALFLVPARTTANNKEQLLLDLVSRAVASLNLGLKAIFNPLPAREELDPTGLGEGFALPRARIASMFLANIEQLAHLPGAVGGCFFRASVKNGAVAHDLKHAPPRQHIVAGRAIADNRAGCSRG